MSHISVFFNTLVCKVMPSSFALCISVMTEDLVEILAATFNLEENCILKCAKHVFLMEPKERLMSVDIFSFFFFLLRNTNRHLSSLHSCQGGVIGHKFILQQYKNNRKYTVCPAVFLVAKRTTSKKKKST